jgi:hypothetical protein
MIAEFRLFGGQRWKRTSVRLERHSSHAQEPNKAGDDDQPHYGKRDSQFPIWTGSEVYRLKHGQLSDL